MDGASHIVAGLLLGFPVGVVLGLLGGGGSILALPIFLYVFGVAAKPAIAMSLAVVGMSAFVGFLTHWRQGTVNVAVALPFGFFAMIGAFATARLTRFVPERIQLALFTLFAATAALLMLRDPPPHGDRAETTAASTNALPRWRRALNVGQGLGVGVLTALIGAGGGFVIVPALTLVARIPIKVAVGSSLLVIAMNAAAGFLGYLGQVEIIWPLVASFTLVAGVGAVLGTRLARRVSQRTIRRSFAFMIMILGGYLVLRELLT
ncbi:MAG: sulfite exporter TauE/SafE family protein [Gemmatimonadota bacterium]